MVDEVFFSFDEIIISLSPSFFAQSCITTSTIYIYDATANIYVFNANPAYSRVEVHERPSNSFTANKQANITGYGSVSGHNVFSYLFFFSGGGKSYSKSGDTERSFTGPQCNPSFVIIPIRGSLRTFYNLGGGGTELSLFLLLPVIRHHQSIHPYILHRKTFEKINMSIRFLLSLTHALYKQIKIAILSITEARQPE